MAIKTENNLFTPFLNSKIIVTGIICGVALAFFLPTYFQMVINFGHLIPQDDMITDYSTAIVWAGILGSSIFFWPVSAQDKHHLLWAWLIKCITALYILLFYENSFDSDASGYFGIAQYDKQWVQDIIDGTLISGFLTPFGDTWKLPVLILYFNRIIPEVLANSYHSLKISFTMLGFVGIYLFHRASRMCFPQVNYKFFWVLILFPSLLIWSTRIGKEPLSIFTVSLYVLGMVGWHYKQQYRYFFIGLVGLLLCSFLRPWMGVILSIPIFFYFLYSNKALFTKLFLIFLTAGFIWNAFNFLLFKFELISQQDVLKKIEFHMKHNRAGESAIKREVSTLSSITDLIKHAPEGMFTALFRPLPLDVRSPLGFLAGLEGMLLLLLFFRAIKNTKMTQLADPLIVWAIITVLSWSFLYGFAIQNFGTAVRWKTQILPIFLGLLLYLGQRRSETPKIP